MCPNSPPGLGGVAAPPRKCSRSLLAQTGWSGLARSHLIDTRVALLIQSVRFANIIRSLRIMDRPPRRSLANGTPPNLLIITHKSSAGQRRLGQPEGKAKSPPWTNIKNGVVRSTSDNRWLEPTTPSAPAKEASRHFLNGRSHPSLSKEGTYFLRTSDAFCFPSTKTDSPAKKHVSASLKLFFATDACVLATETRISVT